MIIPYEKNLNLKTAIDYAYNPNRAVSYDTLPISYDYSPRNLDLTPSVDTQKVKDTMSVLYDDVVNAYSMSEANSNLSGASRFAIDSAISYALNKPLDDVVKNHDMYVTSIIGENIEDKSFAEAFADSWTTYYDNRELAIKQLMYDWSSDDEYRARILDDISDIKRKIIRKQDYKSRGFVSSNLVKAAPIINQMVEAMALTATGTAIGGALNGALSGLSAKETISQIGKAIMVGALSEEGKSMALSTGLSAGARLGAASNIVNTLAIETGSLSNEMFDMADENGERIDDNTRKLFSLIGGIANTIIEYSFDDPILGRMKLGKSPKLAVSDSVTGMLFNSLVKNRVIDAMKESTEEGLQSAIGYIAGDLARYVSTQTGQNTYKSKSIYEEIKGTLLSGLEAYKETFMPVLVSSYLPGAGGDILTSLPKLYSGDKRTVSNYDPKSFNEAKKMQEFDSGTSSIFPFSVINLQDEKYSNDYGKSDDGSPMKLDAINIIKDPDNQNKYVGMTKEDSDKLKYLYDKGQSVVAVNVVDKYAGLMTDEVSLKNTFSNNYSEGTIIARDSNEAKSIINTLTGYGAKVDSNLTGFSYVDIDTGKNKHVSIIIDSDLYDSTFNSKQTAQKDNAGTVKESNDTVEQKLTQRDTKTYTELSNTLKATDAGSKLDETQLKESTDLLYRFISAFGNDVKNSVTFGTMNRTDKKIQGSVEMNLRNRNDGNRLVGSASILLNKNADPTTVVHEVFHVAIQVNQKARQQLVSAIEDSILDDDKRSELEAFLNDNVKIIVRKSGAIKSTQEAMQILNNISENRILNDKKTNELVTYMYDAYGKSLKKSSVPAPLRNFFNRLTALFRGAYKEATGQPQLPESIQQAFLGFTSDITEDDSISYVPSVNKYNKKNAEPNLDNTTMVTSYSVEPDIQQENDGTEKLSEADGRLTELERKASERISDKYRNYNGDTLESVNDMISARIPVPENLLYKYQGKSEIVDQEISDRMQFDNFMSDRHVSESIVNNDNDITGFINDMKEYYGSGYNDNVARILRKLFIYSKTPTKKEMLSSFRKLYANRDGVLRLKSIIFDRPKLVRQSGKKSYTVLRNNLDTRIGNALKDITMASSQEAFDKVIDSINRNTVTWLSEYIKAKRIDNAKPIGTDIFGRNELLNSRAQLMYLSAASYEFKFIEDIRKAVWLGDEGSHDSMTSNEIFLDARKSAEIRREMKQLGTEYFNEDDSIEYEVKHWQSEVERIAKEIDDIVDDTRFNAKVSEDILKSQLRKKLDETLDAYRQQTAARDAARTEQYNEGKKNLAKKLNDQKAKEKSELRQKKNEQIREAVKNERLRKNVEIIDIRQMYHDIMARELTKLRERKDAVIEGNRDRYTKIEKQLKDRIKEIKLANSLANKNRNADKNIARMLNVDLSRYSLDIADDMMWVYSLMHDRNVLSDVEYARYAQMIGENPDSDVIIFKPDTRNFSKEDGEFFNEALDSDSFEYNPTTYRFIKSEVPSQLAKYLSSDDISALTGSSWKDINLETKARLANAIALAKAEARNKKRRMDNVTRARRDEMSVSFLADALGSDNSEIPADVLSVVLKNIGVSEDEYNNPVLHEDLRHAVVSELRQNMKAYIDINSTELSGFNRLMGGLANAMGHIQSVAKFIDGGKEGAFTKLFVNDAQKALSAYNRAVTSRNEEATRKITEALGGEKLAGDRIKALATDKIGITYNSNVGAPFTGEITLNEALQIAIYAENSQSFINLVDRTGNNLTLDTIAMINPKATKRILDLDLEQRMNDSSYKNGSEYKGLLRDCSLDDELRVIAKIESGEYSNMRILPEWFNGLSDTMLSILNGENGEYTEQMMRFSVEKMNMPFVAQENYFPKVMEHSTKVNTIGETSGNKSRNVASGSMKQRKMNRNYALRLDAMGNLFGAIESQERLKNMYEVIGDMNFIMSDRNSTFTDSIRARYGQGMVKYLDEQISTLAGNKPILSDWEKTMNKALSNIALSKISMNPSVSVKQLLSSITAMASGEVSARDLVRGASLMAGENSGYYEDVYIKYASDIAGSSMDYEIDRLRQTGMTKVDTTMLDALKEKSMFLTDAVDQAVKKMVFYGAYDKYMRSGMSESEAGLKATAVVKMTQSISDSYSLSNIQRNRNPFVRAAFMFTNDLFQQWNMLTFGLASDISSRQYGKAFQKVFGITLVNVSLALIGGGFLPDEDDEGFDLSQFIKDIASNIVGNIPIIGAMLGSSVTDMLTSPISSLINNIVSIPADIADDKLKDASSYIEKILNAGIDALGYFGISSVFLKRGIKSVLPDGIDGDFAINPGYLISSSIGDYIGYRFL